MGWDYRGQTEPFAAVIAIAALTVGLSLYAVTSSEVTSEIGSTTDDEQAVMEAVWQSLNDDGVVHANEQSVSARVSGTVPATPVCITLSAATADGKHTVLERTILGEDGTTQQTGNHTNCVQEGADDAIVTRETHKETTGASRTVPVQLAPGEIRPGRLHVEALP